MTTIYKCDVTGNEYSDEDMVETIVVQQWGGNAVELDVGVDAAPPAVLEEVVARLNDTDVKLGHHERDTY